MLVLDREAAIAAWQAKQATVAELKPAYYDAIAYSEDLYGWLEDASTALDATLKLMNRNAVEVG